MHPSQGKLLGAQLKIMRLYGGLIEESSNWYSVEVLYVSFRLKARGKAQLAVSREKFTTPCPLNHIPTLKNIKVFQCDGMKVTQAMLY